ncbi:nickel-binding protein [Gelidibacter sp.]|uniref:nickel-binding protein n=1 Tax=Gelidibacter sp. TaxID=2018083 RepID=UPI0032667626
MPIYMDRHDVSDEVTAEIVANLHQQDLKIQHNFNCKGLTYWFDDKRKIAFCLIEAPDKSAISEMHNHAHGAVPNKVIEVDTSVVESFLGRIEDPKKTKKKVLNIINDPAFRTIMVATIEQTILNGVEGKQTKATINNQYTSIIQTTGKHNGSLVRNSWDHLLVSFDSVTNAVICALDIQKTFKQALKLKHHTHLKLHIGISAGGPVSEKEGIFEDTIQLAKRLCDVVQGEIVISSEVKDLYESENLNISINKKHINVLDSNDQKFLNSLMNYTEKEWSNPNLNVEKFSQHLGYSKSQVYRKITSITGQPQNQFLKQYRLNQALKLLHKKNNNISQVAFETGFNTPAYFSKCFQETYGILPSHYLKSYCC